MVRRFLLLLLPLLFAGCLPVTAPLSDVAKSELDKRLIGTWQRVGQQNQMAVVDVPVVKGNPKGLMRAVYNGMEDDPSNAFWFFTTTIDKHTYMTAYVEPTDNGIKFADFRKEGAFAAYTEAKVQRFFIFRYTFDGDGVNVDGGGREAVKNVMAAEKIASADGIYQPAPGWLAKYLAANDPDKIFDRTNVQEYTRVKK
jgi:hypothetical protein